jgi:ribosomal protein S18 acetylase RimI-like enzyme
LDIATPKTKEEFNQYYYLRWEILRKPFEKPIGSEQDELEAESFHRMCVIDGKIVAVGRLHFNSENEAQIRFMAVHPRFQKQGIGLELVKEFEKLAKAKNCSNIILYARDYALQFYQKLGYETIKKSHMLYGQLQHYLMRKILN